MTMKNMILALALLGCVACSKEPLDEEQYKKQIYIVHSEETDIYYHRDLSYEMGESETYITVACSGSRPQDVDVTVEVEVVDTLLKEYNERFFGTDESKYLQLLPEANYRIPEMKTVLKADGEVYATLPIFVKTEGLSRDVKYVIPVRIKSISAYELNAPISQLLFGFDLVNDYSDIYTMFGKKYDEENVKQNMGGSREMWAIAHNEVRMFVDVRTEDDENLNEDGMILTINEDNSVTIRAYSPEHLKLEDLGGSTYNPATKVFKLNYKFLDTGKNQWYRVEEELNAGNNNI